MASASGAHKEMSAALKDIPSKLEHTCSVAMAGMTKFTKSTLKKMRTPFSSSPNDAKMAAKIMPTTIEVEATADTIVSTTSTAESLKDETSSPAAVPVCYNAVDSFTDSVIEVPKATNAEVEDEQATTTPAAHPATTSGTAATPATLRERVVAVGRRGMEKVGEAYETARAKLSLTKVLFGKTKKSLPAAGAAAGGEVGEDEGTAAAAELPAEAGALVVLEGAGGEAISAKSTRGFWARKARWASKRSSEAKDKVVSGVTAAKQGAKAQLHR